MNTAYIAIDAHANTCTLGYMNKEGTYQNEWQFPTSESGLVRHVARIEASRKELTLEEGPMAGWIGRTLEEYVDCLRICDPRENDRIHKNIHKSDSADTYQLCELLRLGALHEVYHSSEDHRARFKAVARKYLDLRDQVIAHKQKIKAGFHHWGVLKTRGKEVYHPERREKYLARLPAADARTQLELDYALMDHAETVKAQAKRHMVELGSRYPEINNFQDMAGCGTVGAHVFDAFIQTPDRFASASRLWSYCQLAIKKQTSAGQPVGHEGLSPEGVGELKNMSHQVWNTAVHRSSKPNEVHSFYRQSLERTQQKTHARLNTQRKILKVLWTIWRKDRAYQPERFAVPAG